MRHHNPGWVPALLLTVPAIMSCLCAASAAQPAEVKLARPTPQQYAWHEQERILFVCLDPATWQGREYDNHSTPLSAINPAQLDTGQWCRAAKLWGAKEILFVAKHTGGFCWWQTDTSKYGVKQISWRGGQGDVVKDLAESCRKQAMKLGVYLSPQDDQFGAGGGGRCKTPEAQENYHRVYRQQLTELLSRYGEVFEVWFDGSCVINVSDILSQHAPGALIFQGPHATIRWPGTESGILPYPAWNSLKSQDLKTGVATAAHGNSDGDAWAPLEADTTLYNHKWFWSAENEKKRKSLDELMDIYYKSAGRGGVLLLNSAPNTNGLIPEGDLKLYEAFGQEIERRFGHPVAEVKDQRGPVVELALPRPALINHIVLMEDYREGERIREYVVEGFSDGSWRELSRGTSVGRKKIDRFHPAQVAKVRLRATRSAAEPLIRRLAVFQVEGVSAGSLTTGRPTTASTFHSAPYVAAMATDDDPQTRWGCPDGTTAARLEVDLGAPTAFGRVTISELADRIRKFTLDYRDATNAPWKTALAGSRVGAKFQQDFRTVVGRFVRLNITEASGPPTIWEFNLHPGVISDARVKELQNLRWGMFVCWSFSTFSGKEWTPGITNLDLFHPTGCDTDKWVKTAREAQMGYILFLTKHHDGFCLWDTKTTDRKVTKSALGRDVLAELKKSCDKHGIKLALYFSEGEWDWPNQADGKRYQANGGYNPEMKKAQLRELLTGYGPVEYIWFDHAIGDGGLSHAETLAFCKALQPDCFIGFNHGDQAGADIRLGELGRPGPLEDRSAAGPYMGDGAAKSYRLAEFTYPILPPHQGGAMWFYSLPSHDKLCLPAEKLYADYLGAVKYGNIFALDVGPDHAGRLREVDVQTLRKAGQYIRGEITLPPPPISRGKLARASSLWQSQRGFDAAAAVDGDPNTRWGAAENSRSGWLEVDLGRVARVGRAVIDEGDWNRVRQFEIQAKQDGDWKTIASGTTIGPAKGISFLPVAARVFRLNILAATDVPTIHEFELFEVK
jgi:alpha-L-fucosidase